MAEVVKSIKLVTNEFTKSIAEVPLEVYYQTVNADQYNSNGFQFNIKSPGQLALLDTDVWIKYKVRIVEGAVNELIQCLENPAINVAATLGAQRVGYPIQQYRFGFRGGNIMQRAIQNFSVMINNRTITVQPYQFIDVLNRLYISNDQSEHEFSASGGRFDEGNHGSRVDHVTYYDRQQVVSNDQAAGANPLDAAGAYGGTALPSGWANAPPAGNASPSLAATTFQSIAVFDGYMSSSGWFPTNAAQGRRNFPSHLMRPDFPVRYPFYNPGFAQRYNNMIDKLRTYAGGNQTPRALYRDSSDAYVLQADILAQDLQFKGNLAADTGGAHTFDFEIMERLPIPLFKMYSNDECFGVLPNIVQMQIQGNFLTNFLKNIWRSSNNALNITANFDNFDGSMCQLYLRWYTPPQTMTIPREITIPYKQINVWSKSLAMGNSPNNRALANTFYAETSVSEYGITLAAIPDLLLIYFKYNAGSYSFDTPDDFNAEWYDLTINIDNASGKLNQITSLDLYNKWKKLLKHSDNRIITYDEWRKYCCVAALQPEDYGCRYGPGYSNSTNLAIKGTARFWCVNPSIMYEAHEELGGGDAHTGTDTQLIVVSIYNRNSLTIRADGSASEELLKMAADFNMGVPAMGAVPPPDVRGVLIP